MPPLESSEKTFDKRFMADHFSYRDYYGIATTVEEVEYRFGTAARAINTRNWPAGLGSPFIATGDYSDARECYARRVMLLCEEDAWFFFTSLNPRWLTHYNQYRAQSLDHTQALARLVDDGFQQTITEVPHFLPADALIWFGLTYGMTITFYQDTASGTIRIWAEGNTEGRE